MVYTPKVQYQKKWTRELLLARGMVVDDEGNIIARPLQKFFNHYEICDPLPSGQVQVYEKMDGSLIMMLSSMENRSFAQKDLLHQNRQRKLKKYLKKNISILK